MNDVLDRITSKIMLQYQEVVLLASLLNQHREEHDVCEEVLVPQEQYPHLLVEAFACVLGSSFECCQGEVLSISRNISCQQGVLADIRFKATQEVAGVRTWATEHSWLRIPEFDIWIDVVPPGSDVLWLSPVRYLPNIFRPAYTRGVLSKHSKPRIHDVRDMVKLLVTLQKERGPGC